MLCVPHIGVRNMKTKSSENKNYTMVAVNFTGANSPMLDGQNTAPN